MPDEGVERRSIELARERPLREVLAAVERVLLPGAPLPVTHTASLGSRWRLPDWVPMTADIAPRFVMPPGSVVESGVDPVSGMVRGPEDPPPNRPPVDAELAMDGGPTGNLGLVATPVIRVTDSGVVTASTAPITTSTNPRPVLVDVRGQRRPWATPSSTDLDVVIEVRASEQGPRWRPRRRTSPGPAVNGMGSPLGPWLALDVPPPGPARSGSTWWSAAWDVGDGLDPATVAVAVVRAALSGVVLDGRGLPAAVRCHLAPELDGILQEPSPSMDDPLAWERRSVRQRRAAVRGHAAALAMESAIRPEAAVPARLPTVSALLVTRRPGLAASALEAMERQTYPELDVVLAIHGVADDPELERRVAASRLRVELITVPAAATLGEALGIATARARGSLITKVDDDDIYGPEHIWDLVVARAVSGATVVGKPAQYVLLEQQGVTVRRDRPSADVYGRVVAGGTMLMARGELEAMGGWRPVRSGVDRALLDRVLHAGGTIYQTWSFGFIYRRHGDAHTWDVSDAYFLRSVIQRWEGLPDLPEFGPSADADGTHDVYDRLIAR